MRGDLAPAPAFQLLAGRWLSSDGALWIVSKFGLATNDSNGSKVQVELVLHHPPSGPAYRVVFVQATDSWLDGYAMNAADLSPSALTWMKLGCEDITWRQIYYRGDGLWC